MPCGVGAPFGIIAHIAIAIQAPGVGIYRISPREPSAHRVIIAEVVIDQARFAVEALAGEVVVGRHVAAAIARGAVGAEELDGLEATRAGESDGGTAQQVGQQVGEGAAHAHAQTHAVDAVELAGGGAAAVDDLLGVAIEGDGVSILGRIRD